jgi:hypothetical protein
MKKIFTLIVTLAATYSAAWAQLTTFNYTGAIQTYTVPAGVTSLTVTCFGGQGGSGATGSSSAGATLGGVGGLGSMTTGTLAVTPGQVINVFVGGQGGTPTGGFNGGGNGGSLNAGGGGGASDIRVAGTAETDRVIVAAGGGGGGRGGCESNATINGGAGGAGGSNGANGIDAPTSGGNAGAGYGAVAATGGAAGLGCGGFLGAPGANASTGTGANGGNGQSCCCFSFGSIPGGGGGGGGFIGGGGGGGGSAGTTGCSGNDKGAGGGGAGGSNNVAGVTASSTVSAFQSGDGIVTIAVPLSATSTMGSAILCNGGSTTVTVVASGGIAPYVGEGTFTVTAGTHNFTVTDAAAGSFVTTITVTEPTAISTSIVSTNVSCNGGSNGAIDITVSGGTPGYSFNWNAGAFTTEDLTGLAAGSYVGVLTDANGCTDGGTVIITEPAVLVSTSVLTNPTTCSGVNGAIDVSVSGGTSAYTFLWSNGAVTEDVTGLVAGSYSYTVTDANGCSTTASATLSNPPAPSVTVALTVDTVCVYNASFALTGGLPAGGTFSGTGVTLGSFNPASATAGVNVITYTFTDMNGCVGTSTDNIFVDACTGITTVSEAGFSVYPNPTSGLLNVETTTDDNTITVFDLVGNAVYTVKSTSLKTEIDMQNFANGIYFLKVENSKTVSTIRIVRSK